MYDLPNQIDGVVVQDKNDVFWKRPIN